ncbi:Bcr/CflA family multidrug efflux MFS transporter [Marinobacter hydrocarbonoclasticus]|mgnify:FL=1|uniref:Bcr/CflA family multidrug efflux MFS transporter n=1 Tax=Marinobacter nauticus TaxID=2743 RepID=UPI001C95621D|nr:Bcr/CflA family multidrug efflux MFS transporter [Marinobacter nauticus]MBY6194886.1 Bcr/CflA family multidrug efflux MFS transporter [Marinobacter nauticus]MBY6216034.1 Bcr/CflA family multidrug efflux MFS transporter [Marinobacter nauticus]MED5467999.1 Bcr/CflA family multidrug efflux MFS transporter [Pseudomonadota bacterium]
MLALTSIWTTILLAAAVALGPLAVDMYLPALPQIGADFDAGTDQVQLTLSVYLAGFAIAQLICGPLADRFGRKPIMIGGFLLFTVASIGCALANNIETLQLFRFLQALGGSAGPVLGRAIIRDIYTPREAAKILALLASIMALAPAVAPTLGGLMVGGLSWHWIFIAMGGYALVMAAVTAFGIPEPLKPEYRQPLRLCHLFANYRRISTDASFIGYTLTNAAIYGGLFAFLSGASFVLIDVLGVQPEHFGFYFAAIVVGYIAGNLGSIRLARYLGPDQILFYGLVTALAGGAIMALLAYQQVYSPWAVMIPQAIFMAGTGLVLPQCMAGALANFPTMAGSASALFGFIQMSAAAIAGAIVGALHNGTPLVMATVIATCAGLAMIGYLLLVQRYPAKAFETGKASA